MADFLIKESTLEAIGDAIRETLDLRFISSVDAGDGVFVDNSVRAYYKECIDGEVPGDATGAMENFYFLMYSFLRRQDTGAMVPVIYDDHEDFSRTSPGNIYYYEGLATIDGVTYDKWRQIEPESHYNWTYDGKVYIYTNVIVERKHQNDKINPLDMPNKIREIIAPSLGTCTITLNLSRIAAYNPHYSIICYTAVNNGKIEAMALKETEASSACVLNNVLCGSSFSVSPYPLTGIHYFSDNIKVLIEDEYQGCVFQVPVQNGAEGFIEFIVQD